MGLPSRWTRSGLPTQTIPDSVDRRDNLANARVTRWTTHQVAGTRHATSPHVAHGLEALQEPLPRLGSLQATAVSRPITHWHMTALNCFGRLTACAMQAGPDVKSAWTASRHGLDVRLVVIGDHLIWNHAGALDGLPKERLRTYRIAVLAQEHVHV